jgi:hypothetical protein
MSKRFLGTEAGRVSVSCATFINSSASTHITAHEEVSFWQDSVLLLAFVDTTKASFRRAMRDVKVLKGVINALHPCHVVCVKGQSFPAPSNGGMNNKPRVIHLSASSLAFSNCFKVEDRLKRRKADWYIDSRIVAKISPRKADAIKPVKLLPGNISRAIHIFHGSFVD